MLTASMVANRRQDLAERHAGSGFAAAGADAIGFNPPGKRRHAVAGRGTAKPSWSPVYHAFFAGMSSVLVLPPIEADIKFFF